MINRKINNSENKDLPGVGDQILFIFRLNFRSYELIYRMHRITKVIFITLNGSSKEQAIAKYPGLAQQFEILYSKDEYNSLVESAHLELFNEIGDHRKLPRMITRAYLMAFELCKNSMEKYEILRTIIMQGGILDLIIRDEKMNINFKKPITPLSKQDSTEWARVLKRDLLRSYVSLPGKKTVKNFKLEESELNLLNTIRGNQLPQDLSLLKSMQSIDSISDLKDFSQQNDLCFEPNFEKLFRVLIKKDNGLISIGDLSAIETVLKLNLLWPNCKN